MLSEIVNEKADKKAQLVELKNDYMAIIYGGLARQESIDLIGAKLRKLTLRTKKEGKAVSPGMLKVALLKTKKLKNDLAGVSEDQLPNEVYKMMKKREVEKDSTSAYLKEVDKWEGDDKIKVINKVLSHNLDQIKKAIMPDGTVHDTNIKIFYLASFHKDSASDHKDYQGKMYIDENWEKIDFYYSIKNAIKYYIRQHNIQTIQWVTGKPVWLITRPNCRHYFKELSIKEVLANSKTSLLEKHNMKTAIGDREYLQTINHSKDKEWYDDVRNAQLLLQAYENRLAMHQKMYKEQPSEILKNAIVKDKFLIKKWKEYIKKKEKEKGE